MKMKPKIIVCIEGGLVQAIYAENFEDKIPDVEVIDLDNDKAEEDDKNLQRDLKRLEALEGQIATEEVVLLY